jgi:hypothetical protein
MIYSPLVLRLTETNLEVVVFRYVKVKPVLTEQIYTPSHLIRLYLPDGQQPVHPRRHTQCPNVSLRLRHAKRIQMDNSRFHFHKLWSHRTRMIISNIYKQIVPYLKYGHSMLDSGRQVGGPPLHASDTLSR